MLMCVLATHLVCYIRCMPTTRPRVNLTLTEMEQWFLEAIMTEGTTDYEIYADYLRRAGLSVDTAQPTLADVVHVLLGLGLQRLHEEAAEISYAAEAAAETDEDRAIRAYLHRNLLASVAQDDE
jgi:hypothetical protein